MINAALENPKSIAVVGASNKPGKPGGRLVLNLLDGGYKGTVYPVNPKESLIHGLKCYNSLNQLPQTDLAILALHPSDCVDAVEELAATKETKAFIIVSAGFAETGYEGQLLEEKLRQLAFTYKLAIIGPNCIGVLNPNYKAIFVSSLPEVKKGGIDYVTASGAFAVFLFDLAIRQGLRFGNIYSVGNSATIGIEEVLQYWDQSFEPTESGRIKLVYAEQIRKPELFFKHIYSLRQKGCQVIVLKPGDSEAGARAALSHTGSMAGDKEACGYLINKAGALRCYSREELVCLANILSQKKLAGKNLAIITHAGGPAVMLTDQLQKAGLQVPEIDSENQKRLLEILHPGSSAVNPVDILATGNRDQLSRSIKICHELSYIDGIIVIYGKTGLEDLFQTYSVLHKTIEECEKPVYAVLPSVSSGQEEIAHFVALGQVVYFNEILLADCLGKRMYAPQIFEDQLYIAAKGDDSLRQQVLTEDEVRERLSACAIPQLATHIVKSRQELHRIDEISFPVVAKVLGILHKTEHKGVLLNIRDRQELDLAFTKLSEIEGSKGILVQEMLVGVELYLGGKKHDGLGYSVHAGVGGVFIELLRDTVATLAPVSYHEAQQLLYGLKAQKLFEGFRNQPPVKLDAFATLLVSFSRIFSKYPDIIEIDLNPLISTGDRIVVVDARIIIEVPQT